jgi:hypothetical protein
MTDSDAGISRLGRTDQAGRQAPRLVDVGAPSRRTRFLRWRNRTPLAAVVGVSAFLFLMVVSLIIVGSGLLMPSPVM